MRILILLSVLLLLAGCNQQNNLSISGTVENGNDTYLILELYESNQTIPLDSVKINKDGRFDFNIYLENPELLILKSDHGDIINLLGFPGEAIKVKSDYRSFSKEYEIEGSPESEKIIRLVSHLAMTRHKLDSLENEIVNIVDIESPRVRLLQNAYNQVYLDQKRYNIRFIVENLTSLSSVYALFQKLDNELYLLGTVNDLQYFKIVYDSLSVYYPNSSLVEALRADIAYQEQQINEANRMSLLLEHAEESGILPVSLPDINGDTISLKDLNNKVVLLFFWTSQDDASIRALLNLRPTYNKYHPSGFEIYAVSLDNNKDAWAAALKYNEFNWINVSELSYPNSIVDRNYNVSKLPTTFLINRDGQIVARDIYGRNLAIWLDNIL